MTGFDDLILWIYSDGDLLMFASRIMVFIFVLETFAYIVSLLVGVSKTALK